MVIRSTYRHSNGFAYLTVLMIVAVIGAGLAATGSVWHIERRRQCEADLLYIGGQYRKAIELYTLATPGMVHHYPTSLKELIRDNRFPTPRRYLRRLYLDPITGGEWGMLKAPDGGVMGIYSRSKQLPIATAIMPAEHYSDWKFIAQVENKIHPPGFNIP